MDLDNFISKKYIKQIEYKSFSPEKINHKWIVSTPKVNKLLSEANRLIKDLIDLGILSELTGYKRNRKFMFKEYFKIFNTEIKN